MPRRVAAQQQQQPRSVSRVTVAAQLDSAFAAADINHDGSVNAGEIEATNNRELEGARAAARTKLQAQFKQLDTNKDGQLSFQEFLAMAPALKATESPDQLLQRLDANHDGKVTAAEFRGPEIAKFDKADANRDGVVTPAEAQAAGKK